MLRFIKKEFISIELDTIIVRHNYYYKKFNKHSNLITV